MTQIGWLASGWLVVDDTVLLSAPSMIFFYFSQSVAARWLHGWLPAGAHGWPNLGGPRSLVATCMMYGRKDTIAAALSIP